MMLWMTAVKNAPLEDPFANNWADILSLNKKRVLEAAGKVFEQSVEKIADFKNAYQAARISWKCNDCRFYTAQYIKSGYIHCEQCDVWRHKKCCERVPFINNAFKCNTCNGRMIDKGDTETQKQPRDYDSGDDFVQEKFLSHKARKRK